MDEKIVFLIPTILLATILSAQTNARFTPKSKMAKLGLKNLDLLKGKDLKVKEDSLKYISGGKLQVLTLSDVKYQGKGRKTLGSALIGGGSMLLLSSSSIL